MKLKMELLSYFLANSFLCASLIEARRLTKTLYFSIVSGLTPETSADMGSRQAKQILLDFDSVFFAGSSLFSSKVVPSWESAGLVDAAEGACPLLTATQSLQTTEKQHVITYTSDFVSCSLAELSDALAFPLNVCSSV